MADETKTKKVTKPAPKETPAPQEDKGRKVVRFGITFYLKD